MKILAIDSSAAASSAAIVSDGKCISQSYINVKLTHSQTLLPMCFSALSSAGLSLNDIDAFAVTCGPGSFTGLRIGIAAVKGMAISDNKPCYCVSSLEALAFNLLGFNGMICAVMDARCGQFYAALFKSEGGRIQRISEDEAVKAESLYERLFALNEKIYLVGDGAQLCFDGAMPQLKQKLVLVPDGLRYAHAHSAALAVIEGKIPPVDCGKLIPKYLRLPQAQRELLKRECEKQEQEDKDENKNQK